MSETRPERALQDLFLSLFDSDGLRRWVALNLDSEVSSDLPGVASLHALSGELVGQLLRRRIVDDHLFEALRRDFPGRAANIEAVRSLWPKTETSEPGPALLAALHRLILSLFSRREDARRWIRAITLYDPVDNDLPGESVGFSEWTYELVHQLERRGLVGDALFDSLSEVRPMRSREIEAVRARFRSGRALNKEDSDSIAGPPWSSPGWSIWEAILAFFLAIGALIAALLQRIRRIPGETRDPLEDERAAFRRRLQARRATQESSGDALRGWFEAAAVLDAFDPTGLRPLGGAHGATVPLTALAARVTEQPDGRWILQERWREPVLSQLLAEGRFAEAQRANLDQRGRIACFMGELAAGRGPDFTSLDIDELTDLSEALRWLGGREKVSSDWTARMTAFLERRRTIEPLRRLTGEHIRGHDEARMRLRAHVDAVGEPDTLMIWGPGGAGKSTLLGTLLLEQEDLRGELPRPFLYLDFDHSELDPLQPRALVEEAARQLGLLYTSRPDARLAFLGIESGVAGDAFTFTTKLGTSVHDAARILAAALRKVASGDPPLLVVLDTFERVQIRGDVAVVQVRRFVDALKEAWPRTRVVISGRAPSSSWGRPVESLHLGGLSRDDALAALAALGVEDGGLAARLVEQVGTTPLNLRLAADVVARIGASAVDGLDGHTRVLGEARDAIVQQGLYTRILGHLDDAAVRAIAHPGLVVRRLTPEIFAHVLAGPCRFDPADARTLFERFARQITLLEREADGALRHRSDVRVLMLQAMTADPTSETTIRSIHCAAEEFYDGRSEITARAELIYHRLWLERPTDMLDAVWDPLLAPLLAPAWDEPVPASARAWLGPRIGQGDASTFDQAAWELFAAREARLHLAIGEASQALDVLRARGSRGPDNLISELEVQALLQLGRPDEAAEVLARANTSADGPARLRRELLAMRIGEARNDAAEIARAGERAVTLAQFLGDAPSELQARVLQAKMVAESGRTQVVAALRDRFLATDPTVLRDYPSLAADVMRLAGPESSEVLRVGAQVFGHTLDEHGVFRFDVFAIGSLLAEVAPRPGAEAAMSRLAARVGLLKKGLEPRELAGRAVRAGRLDHVLEIVLDHGGESAAIRADIVKLIRDDPAAPGARI